MEKNDKIEKNSQPLLLNKGGWLSVSAQHLGHVMSEQCAQELREKIR